MRTYCMFHRIDCKFLSESKYKSRFAAAKDKSIFARAKIDAFIWWLWYFGRQYKTREEIIISSAMLLRYLGEAQSTHFTTHDKHFWRMIKEFVATSFLEQGEKLFDTQSYQNVRGWSQAM